MRTKKVCLLFGLIIIARILQAVNVSPSYGFSFYHDAYNDPLKSFSGDVLNTQKVFLGTITSGSSKNGILNLVSSSGVTTVTYSDPHQNFSSDYTLKFRVRPLAYTSSGWNFRIWLDSAGSRLKLYLQHDGIFYENAAGNRVKIANNLSSTWYDLTVFVQGTQATLVVNRNENGAVNFVLPSSPGGNFLSLSTHNSSGSGTQRAQLDHLFIYTDFNELLFDHSDNTIASHWINFANGEKFGASQLGGGYGNQLILSPGGPNVNIPGYGAGWITALRSRLHKGYYNPMPSGIRDNIGSTANLSYQLNGKRIRTAYTACSQFIGNTENFDNVEVEPWVCSDGYLVYDRNLNDNNNSDLDEFCEWGILMDHEMLTELDQTSLWEDVSTNGGISILRHWNETRYIRPPCSILQFSQTAGAIDENFRVLDISPAEEGNQRPSDTDFGYLQQNYSFRLNKNHGFEWVIWKQNGVVKSERITENTFTMELTPGTSNTNGLGSVPLLFGSLGRKADNGVFVVATSTNLYSGKAVGFKMPRSGANNSRSVVLRNRSDHSVVSTEDRLLNEYATLTIVHGYWVRISTMRAHLGLRAPFGDIYESVRMEAFNLFGTPDQIFNAAQGL